ncbi:pancreas/duodenum homeobox protein 1 [Pseudodesulfovibrio sp. JC047]|uniref:pancreas/duodenum homeobox protein 1 n=1 Tax=Pseudodesulfovibrio sp. JC047 TaxID=2683199 RepID=UPI0013D18741|nr:pancreas/duodenum homeobox protein 1 [Pseudodesulfovibrio sp. JC047]NDV19601.1 pancreas/duodenum homeobox protein 1 [Pseudodesulfovibrio sp. JC047]
MSQYGDIFTDDLLLTIFPAERTDAFFEALFGEAEEGSYDIGLGYVGENDSGLEFEMQLKQRPGKCLACNLTFGLPEVFARHPIINMQGVADAVAQAIGQKTASWTLGATRQVSRELSVIPLTIQPE